ncbi:nucleotide-binding domain-containing protein [Aspergillus californicus]
MVRITILGAGVTGMTIASQLPTDYAITIIGDILPGDVLTKEWASPWAGACWVGVHWSNEREQKIQLESLAGLWRLAKEHPESGLRVTTMTEILEYGSPEDIWYRTKVPEFRLLDQDELPPKAVFGMSYSTVCISPPVFLPWMRSRLEARRVKFQRAKVDALQDLNYLGHDVLVNATGAQSRHLRDVAEKSMVPYLLQSILIRSSYSECFIYRGNDGYYFNMFGRGDGTAYVGGIKDLGNDDRSAYDEDRSLILSRGHELLPLILPSPNPSDYRIVYDIGNTYYFRPQQSGGSRVETEVKDNQTIIHAYGQEAGGYCYSFGVGREVAGLVADHIYELPRSRL